MAVKKIKPRQKINPLIMHRTRGLVGPLFQKVSKLKLVKSQGNSFSPGGPLS